MIWDIKSDSLGRWYVYIPNPVSNHNNDASHSHPSPQLFINITDKKLCTQWLMSKIRLTMDSCWITLHFAGSNLLNNYYNCAWIWNLLVTVYFPPCNNHHLKHQWAVDAFSTIQTIRANHLEHSWQKNMLTWVEREDKWACVCHFKSVWAHNYECLFVYMCVRV